MNKNKPRWTCKNCNARYGKCKCWPVDILPPLEDGLLRDGGVILKFKGNKLISSVKI